MTEAGEQLTLKGEINHYPVSVFSFNKDMGISYSMDIDDRNKVEVKMNYADGSLNDVYQMIFVLKGKIKFRKRGKTSSYGQIGANQHNLYRVTPGANRMVMGKSADDVMCINLSHNFVSQYIPYSHPAHQKLTAQPGTEAPMMLFPLNMHITPEISAILQRLGSASSQGAYFDQLMLESKVIELLALQISQFEQLGADVNPGQLENDKRERMHKAREIIINHTGKQLPLRSLAHMVGTNEFDLKRDFKVVFGNTVYGYLTQYRMEQAKAMLIEKNVTIAEIAIKMGYKHATHFTSAFKKYFGYLPNKLRAGKLLLLMCLQNVSALFECLDLPAV